MDGERTIGENLKIRPIEQIVIHERASRAKLDVTNLTQIHKGNLLVIGRDTAVTDALADLFEDRFLYSVAIENTVLPVMIFVAAWLGDDVLNAGLVEDERRRVLRHVDLRPVGDDALGTVPVGAAAVIGVPPFAGN